MSSILWKPTQTCNFLKRENKKNNMDVKHLPLNRILLLSSVIIGLLLPLSQPTLNALKSLLIPILAIIMFLSVKNFHYSLPTKHEMSMSLKFLLVNYGVLSLTYILLGWFVIDNPAIRTGFWILAVIPPALNIIPLSAMYKGNLRESLFAGTLSLLLALILIPIMTRFVFQAGSSVGAILEVLIFIILIPFILGVGVQQLQKKGHLQIPGESYITPAGNAILFFILIALNKDLLFSHSLMLKDLLGVLGLLLVGKIAVGIWIYRMFLKAKKDERIDALFFASFKNVALAATITMTLFADKLTMLPVTWDIFLFIGQLIFIEMLFAKHPIRRLKKR